MAHEITSTDRYGEVRTGGKRAWHQLGDEVSEGLGAQEALVEIGGDWGTSLEPVFIEVLMSDGTVQYEKVPTHCMHVRDDNREQLGMVGSGYQKFENKDVAAFADQLCGLDAAISVETIGTLRGGRRFFILVKLPKLIHAASNDPLAQYVLFSNGHGGHAKFQAYPTSIRVVCANTLRWSERDVLKGCSFSHTGNLGSKLEEVRTALGIALRENERFEQQVHALAGADQSIAGITAQFDAIYDATEEKLTPGNEERRTKIVGEWTANMDDARQLGGSSLWTGLNAVTQWYDHERGRFKSLEETNSRAHTNLFGLSNKMKQTALKQSLALV